MKTQNELGAIGALNRPGEPGAGGVGGEPGAGGVALYSRRTFVKLAGAVAGSAALAMSGCSQQGTSSGSASASSGAAANNLTELTFVLDYTPNTNHTGIYVAEQLGYYTDEGISLNIVSPPEDGADALIGAGSAQLGISCQDTMANYLASTTPLPYTAIGAIIQHNTSGIMTRAEDGITSPRTMEGHRYATWNLAVEQATIRDVMSADGGSFDKLELVPYAVDDDVAGLRSNAYDCVWVFEGWAVQNAALQNYPCNYFAFADWDPALDFYTPFIAANNDFLQKQADTARAFMRATRKGYEHAIENPANAASLLVAAVPELDESLVKKSLDFLKDQFKADASRWGVFDAERWGRYYQWLDDNGLVEVELSPDAGFSNDYLD